MQHLGLLYIDRVFQSQIESGIRAWWSFNRSFGSNAIDLRLQTMEVTGPDILTKDKVPLRLNLTAGYRISDPLQASNSLADITGFLYKELQFALRGAVGERTLDGLLEDKGTIDRDRDRHSLPPYPCPESSPIGSEGFVPVDSMDENKNCKSLCCLAMSHTS